MLLLIASLIAAGLALFILEAFVPGGILGILGAVLIAIAIFLTFRHHGPLPAAIVFIGSVSAAATVTIVSFKLFAHRVRLDPGQTDRAALEAGAALVGRQGQATATLRPTGAIELDGHRYMARSEAPALVIQKGEPVHITAWDGGYAIVRPIRDQDPDHA